MRAKQFLPFCHCHASCPPRLCHKFILRLFHYWFGACARTCVFLRCRIAAVSHSEARVTTVRVCHATRFFLCVWTLLAWVFVTFPLAVSFGDSHRHTVARALAISPRSCDVLHTLRVANYADRYFIAHYHCFGYESRI